MCASTTHTEGNRDLHKYYAKRIIRACRGRPSRAGFAVNRTGCIEWQGSCNSKGYGYANGALVHRAAWEAIRGPIPRGYEVHHLCRNKLCANVEHLQPMSREEHVKAEGREMKLDEVKVREILALVNEGVSQRQIAAMHGITRPYVSLIKNRRRWRWVSEQPAASPTGDVPVRWEAA